MSIRARVATSLSDLPVAVLAVSGGLDSMALLDAAAASPSRSRLLVATFDHGSGVHSDRAAELVAARALSLGVPVVVGHRQESDGARSSLPSEAAWRAARWTFLTEVARRAGGTIVTAHTRDDQVETVLMRILRGAGARGIAGLFADAPVRRPLLGTSRAELEAYAAERGLEWAEDPSNVSRRFFRNRVRLELLPALRRARPGFDEELLDVAARAAAWRREVEAVAERGLEYRARDGVLDVAADCLAGYSRESLAVLWPALAAKAGIALDRRGTGRLVEFTIEGRVGARIQLAGGWEVARGRKLLELRRLREGEASSPPTRLSGPTNWGEWRFRPVKQAKASDPWSASLPRDLPLTVRRWEPGDTMTFRTGEPARKVKRFLTAARISGRRRADWPVVVAGDEIVWIPGVCRSHAATDRSGRPGSTYRCDLHDR